MYQELKDLGVTFVSKNEQFDTSTAIGEAMLKIILVFAELERNMTSERVTATMLSRAQNGLWNGGRVPYGYDYDKDSKTFSINQEEAFLVRKMYDLYSEHRSLVMVSRQLLHIQGSSRPVYIRWVLKVSTSFLVPILPLNFRIRRQINQLCHLVYHIFWILSLQ